MPKEKITADRLAGYVANRLGAVNEKSCPGLTF